MHAYIHPRIHISIADDQHHSEDGRDQIRGLVSCVESVSSCASVNPQTPGVNKWKDPELCISAEDGTGELVGFDGSERRFCGSNGIQWDPRCHAVFCQFDGIL